MTVKKLDSTDGFVVYDYPDSPSSGLVRRGRKILQRSATDLARSATYAFAFHEIRRGGASAGINAEGEAQGPALEAMLAELAEPMTAGNLELAAGKGVHGDELPGADSNHTDSNAALTSGVLAAAEWALGTSLDGVSVAIEGFDADSSPLSALHQAVTDRGANVVAPNADAKPWEIWGSEVDLLLPGSKPGAMNHQGADIVKAKAVVPWGPIPVTTKALAVLLRNGVTYVPDFVAASGPVIANHIDTGTASPAETLSAQVVERLEAATQATDESLFVACCMVAERFLESWQDSKPFGRPLAG